MGALLCVIAAAVQAGTFVPEDSSMSFRLSGMSESLIAARPGTQGQVGLVDNGMGGHDLVLGATVWSTVNYGRGTSLYTGLPVIGDIRITMKNPAATFQSGYSYTNYAGDGGVKGPHLGAVAPLSGSLVVWALARPALVVDIGLLGGVPGTAVYPTLLGISMSVTGGPWATGPLTIAGITTNVISVNGVTGVGITLQAPTGVPRITLSTRGGFVSTNNGLPVEAHTVTISGLNNLVSASQSGTVTLAAPMRINTTPSVAGRIATAGKLTFSFVPEPGTMLLLISGTVALLVIGRRQIRN
jgi:hypothetical protein